MDRRRFLCRGMRQTTDEWVIGYLVAKLNSSMRFRVPMIVDLDNVTYTDIHPQTVGQCIGFEDETGKLIFEGDMVYAVHKCFPKNVLKGPVEWRDYKWFIAGESADWVLRAYNIRIVGDVHEEGEAKSC